MRHEEKGEDSIFWWGGSEPSPVPPLVANLDPLKITLRSVLGLITVIILKRVRESIFLQSNKFTACKVRDGKEEAKSLMVFNLHKYKCK